MDAIGLSPVFRWSIGTAPVVIIAECARDCWRDPDLIARVPARPGAIVSENRETGRPIGAIMSTWISIT
jgi:hypothetical protein